MNNDKLIKQNINNNLYICNIKCDQKYNNKINNIIFNKYFNKYQKDYSSSIDIESYLKNICKKLKK